MDPNSNTPTSFSNSDYPSDSHPTPIFMNNPQPLQDTSDPDSSPLDFLSHSELRNSSKSQSDIDFTQDQNIIYNQPSSSIPADNLDEIISPISLTGDDLTVSAPVFKSTPVANPNLDKDKQDKINQIQDNITKLEKEEVKDTKFSTNKLQPDPSYFKFILLIGPIFLAICLAISFYILNQKLDKPLEVLLQMLE